MADASKGKVGGVDTSKFLGVKRTFPPIKGEMLTGVDMRRLATGQGAEAAEGQIMIPERAPRTAVDAGASVKTPDAKKGSGEKPADATATPEAEAASAPPAKPAKKGLTEKVTSKEAGVTGTVAGALIGGVAAAMNGGDAEDVAKGAASGGSSGFGFWAGAKIGAKMPVPGWAKAGSAVVVGTAFLFGADKLVSGLLSGEKKEEEPRDHASIENPPSANNASAFEAADNAMRDYFLATYAMVKKYPAMAGWDVSGQDIPDSAERKAFQKKYKAVGDAIHAINQTWLVGDQQVAAKLHEAAYFAAKSDVNAASPEQMETRYKNASRDAIALVDNDNETSKTVPAHGRGARTEVTHETSHVDRLKAVQDRAAVDLGVPAQSNASADFDAQWKAFIAQYKDMATDENRDKILSVRDGKSHAQDIQIKNAKLPWELDFNTLAVTAEAAASTPAAHVASSVAVPPAALPAGLPDVSLGTLLGVTKPAEAEKQPSAQAAEPTPEAAPEPALPAPAKKHHTIYDPKVAAWQELMNAYEDQHRGKHIKVDGAWGNETQAEYEKMTQALGADGKDAFSKGLDTLQKLKAQDISLHPEHFNAPATPAKPATAATPQK